LWARDELIDFKNKEVYFLKKFDELPLKFMPTYKYVKKTETGEYDNKRAPAWCDRILFEAKIKQNLEMHFYRDIDTNLSDHKPVYGIVVIKVKKILKV
jgi:hypothetical protein